MAGLGRSDLEFFKILLSGMYEESLVNALLLVESDLLGIAHECALVLLQVSNCCRG
jgi:hypothetical protein